MGEEQDVGFPAGERAAANNSTDHQQNRDRQYATGTIDSGQVLPVYCDCQYRVVAYFLICVLVDNKHLLIMKIVI